MSSKAVTSVQCAGAMVPSRPLLSPPAEIGVEVVYAEPKYAVVRGYRLLSPASLADALRLAAADDAFDGVAIEGAAVGVFGRIAETQQLLEDGDRIEIYRPLAADPKNARRARARRERQSPGRTQAR